jgi:Protein of unknown function (DUF2924)
MANVQKRVAALPGMARPKLLTLWSELHKTPAPTKLRREFLVPFLAYKIQEDAYGGLKRSTRSELRRIAKELDKADGRRRKNTNSRIRPGTRLLRKWHGESHEVTATESGFEYRSERFKSLSQVARQITGTSWSGPAFFGLKAKSARNNDK